MAGWSVGAALHQSEGLMLVIVKAGAWELIPAPQNPTEAWELADRLTAETGESHIVGRA